MISCEGMDRNVVVHGTLEKQNGTAIIPQGKMQTGRTVWEQPVAMTAQTFNQQTVVASQRTTTHYSAKERILPNQRPVKSFQSQVVEVVEELQRNRESEPDDFLYCMEVINKLDKLRENKYLLCGHERKSDNRQFMMSKLADVYDSALGRALGTLKSRAKDGCLWMYRFDLNAMAKTFRQMIPNNKIHKAVLSELYQQYFNQELDNMRYLLEFLPEKSTFFENISTGISYLMDETSPVCYIPLLDDHTLEEFRKRQKELLHDAELHMKNGKAGRDQGELDKLRKTVPRAIAEMWDKREYHEQLFNKFYSFSPDKEGEGNKDHNVEIRWLKEITELCGQYETFVGEPHTKLKRSLISVISVIVKKVLLEIQDTDNTDQVRIQSLKAIDYLSNGGWLKKGCNDLYLDYLKLQQDGTSTKTDYFELDRHINYIYTLLENSNKDHYMLALEELRKFQQYEQHLPEMDRDKMLQSRTRNAKNKLAKSLFYPILDKYTELAKPGSPDKSDREVDTKMRQYKSDFIELNPYRFILASDKAVRGWVWRACCAWHDDIDRLCNATSFSEKDINDLLQLKDIAPDVPNMAVCNDLQTALTGIFQFALKGNTGSVSIEKVAKLSEWIDLLSKEHNICQELQKCNEEWKKKYKGTICDRTIASSDTSTKMLPVFVHPGIADATLNTCGCHSHTEQQIAPNMMRPVTALFYMPAPATATRQPFQQSVPVSCYMATGQSPVEIRPQPEQPLQAYHETPATGQIPGASMMSHFPMHSYLQPAPPHMPALATRQPFQQSVPVSCYMATGQSPAEIRPQPEQPLQAYHETPATGQIPGASMISHFPMHSYLQPAPPHMPAPATRQPFQQSVPVSCYMATGQSPAEIRPQPEQPLQAYHETPATGQIPGAAMASHFPVCSYTLQLPVYEQTQPEWQAVFQHMKINRLHHLNPGQTIHSTGTINNYRGLLKEPLIKSGTSSKVPSGSHSLFIRRK